MTTNNRGTNRGYDATLAANMAAFDQLPKALRVALAAADFNWSARQCLTQLRRTKRNRRPQFANANTAAAFIHEQDIAQHKRDAEAGYICPDQR
jgi:hypothetical protein